MTVVGGEAVDYLVSEFNADYIIDISDTWAVNKAWLRDLASAMSSTAKWPRSMVFADARHIRNGTAELMASVGVDNVLIGVESGSASLLARNGKRGDSHQITEAVRSLSAEGISTSMSFVLGLPGESGRTLAETRIFIDMVSQIPLTRCYVNVIIPIPGSPAWNDYTCNRRRSSAGGVFAFDLDRERRDFVESQTSVSVERLLRERDSILRANRLAPIEFAR